MSLLSLTTPRLSMTRLTVADAEFICKLTTDPEWLKHIGDRGVTDITSATSYIENAHLAMYSQYGVGLLKVTELDSLQPVGVCGLMQRNAYDLPDSSSIHVLEKLGFSYQYQEHDAGEPLHIYQKSFT